jgi:hypothetical protein
MSGIHKTRPVPSADVAKHCKEILEGLVVVMGTVDCLLALVEGRADRARAGPLAEECRQGIRRAADATQDLQRRCG